MKRIFTGDITGNRITRPDVIRHMINVMRLRQGDAFTGYDGRISRELLITGISGDSVTVDILSEKTYSQTGTRLHLTPALIKGQRWELLLEKAVELGVAEITPLVATRSVVKITPAEFMKKHDRWHRILEGAAAQSDGFMPAMNLPIGLNEFITSQTSTGGLKAILVCGDRPAESFSGLLEEGTRNVTVLCGPEGDWEEGEIMSAITAGFVPASLGSRILRAETAAIAAAAICMGAFAAVPYA